MRILRLVTAAAIAATALAAVPATAGADNNFSIERKCSGGAFEYTVYIHDSQSEWYTTPPHYQINNQPILGTDTYIVDPGYSGSNPVELWFIFQARDPSFTVHGLAWKTNDGGSTFINKKLIGGSIYYNDGITTIAEGAYTETTRDTTGGSCAQDTDTDTDTDTSQRPSEITLQNGQKARVTDYRDFKQDAANAGYTEPEDQGYQWCRGQGESHSTCNGIYYQSTDDNGDGQITASETSVADAEDAWEAHAQQCAALSGDTAAQSRRGCSQAYD